jgi:DNA-directed RNA polymerase specialized sigma24 family protein
MVQRYGDLLFDLCESVLWSPGNAQGAFQAILKEIQNARFGRSGKNNEGPSNYERAWVLRVACEKLQVLAARHARRLSPSEQIELNANPTVSARLKQFDAFFHRLSTPEQILLLLRDKYGLPLSEISVALGMPEGSLKIQRQQALRTLEEWLWEPEAK